MALKLGLLSNSHNSKNLEERELQKRMLGVMTFGDVLYDFCKFRTILKSFTLRQLYKRKINRMLNFTSEIIKAVTYDEHLPYFEEFYRE